jgi:hypothetical protein
MQTTAAEPELPTPDCVVHAAALTNEPELPTPDCVVHAAALTNEPELPTLIVWSMQQH